MPARDARYRKLTYPPTAAAVISGTHFLVGGGGGKAKTGVPNRITLVADGKPDLQVCAPPAFSGLTKPAGVNARVRAGICARHVRAPVMCVYPRRGVGSEHATSKLEPATRNPQL